MAETIRGINVVIGADTTGLSKALSDVNKRSKDIQSELKQVEKLLKLDPSNTELLAQKQKLLGDAIANTREKLDRLRAVQEQVNEQFQRGEISEGQYRAFQREVAKTEQELKKLETQLKGMEPAVKSLGERMQEAGEKMKKAGEKMSDVGKKLSVGVTAPIVGLGTVATKAAIDFESAFAGVRKTVDATEEEFAQLEQGIREMSKRMPAAATDIAAVAEAAGQLGIETDNILKFTEVMIGLGEATNLTAEEGATQFARFANIVGMSQQDFDRLGSAVVALGNSFATTEAEIVAMGLRLAGQGAQIGMTEAQIMALAAAMSSVGIEAEAGGTAMSTVLKKMQIAVDEAGEDLENFAKVARMSAEDFARAFRENPAAALQAFVDGLAASSAEGANLTAILNELGIRGIRESDTMLRLAGANDVLRGALETATQAWAENSALQNEVAQRYATTESQLAMFRNQLTDVAITLGQALIPALMDVLDAAQPIIDMVADMARWFANLDEGAQKVIIGIAGFAAALGPLLIIIGQLTSGIGAIITAFGGLTAASTAAAAGTAAAGTAAGGAAAGFTALLGPIGLVIAAIAALAAGAYLIIKNWDTIKEFFSNLWESTKEVFSAAWDWLKNFLSEWGPAILAIIAPVIGIPLLIAQHWDTIKEFLVGLWDSIVAFLSDTWDKLKGMAKNAFESILDVIRPILDGFKKIFSAAWDAIKNIFAGALLLIIDLVTGDFKNLKKDAEAIWNNLKDAFGRIWDGIKQVFSEALRLISDALSTAWEGIRTAANTAWDRIRTTITDVVRNTIDRVRTTWNELLNWFRNLPGTLYRLGTDMFERMRDAVVTTVTRVKDAIVTGVTEAIDWLKGLPSQLMQLGKDMIQGLVNGIKNMIGSVGDAVKNIADKITGGLRDFLGIKSPSRVLMQLGEYTGEGFVRGLEKTIDAVRREAAEMAAAVTGGLSGLSMPGVAVAGGGVAAAASSTINMDGLFAGATIVVRNDDDIRQLAREIWSMATQAQRGLGGVRG